MADTQRSFDALQALFGDNVIGDISPQDLRDFLQSSMGGWLVVSLTGVEVEIGPAGGTVTGTPLTGGEITYNSGVIGFNSLGMYLISFHLQVDLPVLDADGVHQIGIYSGDDGAFLVDLVRERPAGSGEDLGAVTLSAEALVVIDDLDDPITLHIAHGTDNEETYTLSGQVIVKRLGGATT